MSTEIEYSLNDTVVHATDPESEQLRIAYFREGRTASLPEEVIVSIEKGRQVRMHPRELIESIAKISGLEVEFGKKPVGVVNVQVSADTSGIDPSRIASEVAFAMRGAEATAPKPAPLWDEIEYHPAIAVKVTAELVRHLRDQAGEHPELRELKPVFSTQDGKPWGVAFHDPVTLGERTVSIGARVVLRNGQPPQSMGEQEFEKIWRKVAA